MVEHEEAVQALQERAVVGDGDDRPLLVDYVTGGELHDGFTGPEGVQRARRRHAESVAELPRAARRLSEGEPVIPTVIEPGTAH